MNGAFYIILVPAVLVATGYIIVLRFMGIAPGYPRLVIVGVIFFVALYWLSRRKPRGGNTSTQ